MSKEDYAKQFYKTRLCRFFIRGKCFKGAECSHAHSRSELNRKPNLMKTSLCRNWSASEVCEKGSECPYAHGAAELRSCSQKTNIPDQASFSESTDGGSTEPDMTVRKDVSSPSRFGGEYKESACFYETPPPKHVIKRLGDRVGGSSWAFAPQLPHLPSMGLAAYQYPFVQMVTAPIAVQEGEDSPQNWLYQD